MAPIESLDDADLREHAENAKAFLSGFRWCRAVRSGHLAYGIGGVLGVFLFQVEPAEPGVDDTLWVIVGDLPSAYLVCDQAPNWRTALEGYVFEMRRWVKAVRAGESLDDIIPVGAEPTPEHADMLAGRFDFIERHIVGDEVPMD